MFFYDIWLETDQAYSCSPRACKGWEKVMERERQ